MMFFLSRSLSGRSLSSSAPLELAAASFPTGRTSASDRFTGAGRTRDMLPGEGMGEGGQVVVVGVETLSRVRGGGRAGGRRLP